MSSLISRLWFRIRALFDRTTLDHELDAELRDHVERDTKANIARGMTPDEARRTALAAFGGVQRFKEETRAAHGSSWVEWLRQDASITVRSLAKSPGFTAAIVLTLALGVGANAAIYSVLNRIYLQPPGGISSPSELRRLYERLPPKAPMNSGDKEVVTDGFDYMTFDGLTAALRGKAPVAAYIPSDSASIERDAAAEPVRATYVSANYFVVLGVKAERGTFFASTDTAVTVNTQAAVISDALWARTFGRDSTVIGRTFRLHNVPYTIVGVAGPGFSGVDLNAADLFLPLGAYAPTWIGISGRPWYRVGFESIMKVVARVPQGGDRQLTSIATYVNRRFNSDMRGQLRAGSHPDTVSTVATGPIISALGPAGAPKEFAISVRVAGVTLIVLLIACANIANLLLIRTLRRRHEIAVRLALGISRLRLVTQFAIEAALLALCGAAAAAMFAWWGGLALRRLILPQTHWATPVLDTSLVTFALVTSLVAALVAMLAPALEGSRSEIVRSLKPGSRGLERRGSRLRAALLCAQTALSLALLTGAGLFIRSLQRAEAIPLGYATDELAFAQLRFGGPSNSFLHKAERQAALPRAAERLRGVPGVTGVALALNGPIIGGSMQAMWLPGIDSAVPAAYFNAVSPEFFSVAGVKLLEGRAFTADDRTGPGGVLAVNATLAHKLWPGESPLGKCLILGRKTDGCSTVVAQVEDEHMMGVFETTPQPQYFIPLRSSIDSLSNVPGAIIVRTRPGEWRVAEQLVRSELKLAAPTAERVDYRPMLYYLDSEFAPYRLGARLFAVFGALALTVALVGIYGIVAYTFSQRAHELGVRAALGASIGDMYGLVLGHGLRLTAIGVGVGIALSLAAGKLIASLLYATSPRDPVVMLGAALTLLAVGVLASVVPAVRASRADPAEVLRAE